MKTISQLWDDFRSGFPSGTGEAEKELMRKSFFTGASGLWVSLKEIRGRVSDPDVITYLATVDKEAAGTFDDVACEAAELVSPYTACRTTDMDAGEVEEHLRRILGIVLALGCEDAVGATIVFSHEDGTVQYISSIGCNDARKQLEGVAKAIADE